MKTIIAILCLGLSIAAAKELDIFRKGQSSISPKGAVVWIRCGGVATVTEVRIEGCDGQRCIVYPGNLVEVSADMIPAVAATSLTVAVDTILNGGVKIPIMTVELPNSSVQPGRPYTVHFSVVPNDLLSGQTVIIEATVYHTNIALVEICSQVQITVA